MADIEQAASLAAPLEPLRGGKIKLHGRIEVDLDARLAALDAGSGYAYKAADIGDESRALYAVLCDPRVPYRQRPMAVLRGKNHKNHVSVVTAGRISPIGSKEMRLAVVLDRPKGVSLATLLSEGGSRGERWIADAVVPQAFAGLLALHRLGITHRALRPGNIFYNADDGTLVLGQCVTLPAGALQPPSLEPLESAITPGQHFLQRRRWDTGLGTVCDASGGSASAAIVGTIGKRRRIAGWTRRRIAGVRRVRPRCTSPFTVRGCGGFPVRG